MKTTRIKEIAINKAKTSPCRYKISAVGFDKKGKVVGICTNNHRFVKYGGGIHAERRLISRYGDLIKTILICRVGNSGELLPIHPCKTCQKIADKYSIKIISVKVE